MPEGPEVRRHADAVARVVEGRRIVALEARTKAARAWLEARPGALVGRRILRVFAHGKHLVGIVEPGPDGGPPAYFHSHLMMWGRWHTFAWDAGAAPPGAAPPEATAPARPDGEGGEEGGPGEDGAEGENSAEGGFAYAGHEGRLPPGTDVPRDRRERARIVTDGGVALLHSAPVFTVGEGDPYSHEPLLGTLGPDILPYPDAGPFDADAFHARLRAAPEREIGSALLDQRILAGVGNYLRAEVLFLCRIDPWRRVADLTPAEIAALDEAIPALAARAYALGGVTLDPPDAARVVAEPALVYTPGAAWQRRHYVFRRTNLPCFRCSTPIRQLRQVTREADEADGLDEKSRIIYFCPVCQRTTVKLPPARKPRVSLAEGGA